MAEVYRRLNADKVPTKSLHFVSGSKRLEPGEKYGGLYGKFSIVRWSHFIPFSQYSPKIANTYLFSRAYLSLHVVKI